MEGKQRLLQLLAFTNGPAIDVVQQYFELKIIPQGSDFEDYLNDPQNKHRLFHERYPKIPCCECIGPTSIAAPSKRGCLGYQQFSKLYDENGIAPAGHEQTNRSQISQHCLCKVSAQISIKVIDIDLTLLNAIIQHCCNLHITTKIAPWMKVIKEVRNTISHLSEGKLEKNLFEQTWKKLKNATLQCAGDIGHTSVKIFQMTIDLITTCSVDDLEKRILQTTNKLSEVHKDLNGIIPAVQSILSKQNELCDQLCSDSKDLTEVKTLCSGVNTVMVSASVNQERTNDEMEKLNVKTEKIGEDVGEIKHMLQQIKFMCAMKLKPPGENLEEYGKGEKNRKLTLDVDVISAAWDEKRTTCKLEDEMQATKKRVDNDQHDDNTTFVIEKVENKCIYLELSASPEVFQSPQRLRTAIKSLIRQFVQAGELDENVPATVNINIIVNSALTTEEKTVVYTVFSDNDTLDGSDDDEKLQFEQKPRFIVKEPTIEPDQQIASTSAILKTKHLMEIGKADRMSQRPSKSPYKCSQRQRVQQRGVPTPLGNRCSNVVGQHTSTQVLTTCMMTPELRNEVVQIVNGNALIHSPATVSVTSPDSVNERQQSNTEKLSPEETESAAFNEYLALHQRNNPSGPTSFAEYLERSNDNSVVGDCYPSREILSEEGACDQGHKCKITEVEDDNIHRFFLELTATCGLKWTTFLAELGYNPRELFHLSIENRENYFRHYLTIWLETVTRLGQNPIVYLYNALSQERHHELVDKFKRQFEITYSPCLPCRREFALLKDSLLKIPNQTGRATNLNRTEEIMFVEKEIWSNLTSDELAQIKAFLNTTKKEKFGKRVLEEIKNGVDLFRKLHELCLVDEENFDYLITILKFVSRDDLIQKIMALDTPGSRFETGTQPVTRSLSSCSYSVSDQQITTNKQGKPKYKPKDNSDSKFFHSTRIIKDNISAKNEEILQNDSRTKELATKSESCRQEMQNYAEKRMQIEAQIKKLQSDAKDLQSKEASSGSELSSLDVEIKKEKKLHRQLMSELDLYNSTLEKETKKQKELKEKQTLEEELKKKQTLEEEKTFKLHQQKQREYENKSQTLENENKKQSEQKKELEYQSRICRDKEIPNCHIEKDCDDEDKTAKPLSRYESHIARDESTQKEEEAAEIVSLCASSEEARARPLKQELTVEPLILMLAAEENKNDLKSFKSDVLQEATQSVTFNNVHEIIVENNPIEEFLNRTDEEMKKAVLLFILVSDVFAKRCWPDISKMKNLTAALYGSQPLVVPVIIKANVKPPMGLNSAHSLRFYTRDSYYKDALRKLLGQLN